ncbi:hypothetical protein HBO58_08705, partial [Campylobacter jejuni]|uniref:hypothetical protein n=1 Tax=Campylobacter jejuni TaxID=197 RepID=UPI001C8B876A
FDRKQKDFLKELRAKVLEFCSIPRLANEEEFIKSLSDDELLNYFSVWSNGVNFSTPVFACVNIEEFRKLFKMAK